MVHATKFLLRWLYLNNLIYDRAEIQSLPYLHPSQVDHRYHQQQIQQQQPPQQYNLGGGGGREAGSQQHHTQHHQHYHHQQQSPQQHASTKQIRNDHEWKRKALHKIALYPPGTPRLLALDSLRMEIVHELARELHNADGIIQDYNRNCQLKKKRQLDGHGLDCSDVDEDYDGEDESYDSDNELEGDITDLDVMDEDIAKEFEKATCCKIMDSDEEDGNVNADQNQGKLSTSSSTTPILSPELKQALELHRETRDFLPQFVSAILHSPPPLTTNQPDPISTLRHLLMNRCVRDPNLGIELCWLLEAEVGRTWKSLFEHRQQTGRRLILVLPADKAVVIAKIGSEKKNAFDLLNDVECATAYGAYPDDDGYDDYDIYSQENHTYHGSSSSASSSSRKMFTTPRLPASLSMKRCSHFGDTMNFIDQLTKISLRLKHIPVGGRQHVLEESLEELNRRLRRRMATEGNVSLDVEDHLGPYDWPSIGDISLESLKYSVHLPVEPIVSSTSFILLLICFL